jgi:hypothetical protein
MTDLKTLSSQLPAEYDWLIKTNKKDRSKGEFFAHLMHPDLLDCQVLLTKDGPQYVEQPRFASYKAWASSPEAALAECLRLYNEDQKR